LFRAFLRILDDAWLVHVAERDKSAAPESTSPPSS
jgi:hypothetical protein